MAEEKKTTRAKKVKLAFPYEGGVPGQAKEFFNLQCIADDDGVYCCEVTATRAKQELKRTNVWKFVKYDSLKEIEDDE